MSADRKLRRRMRLKRRHERARRRVETQSLPPQLALDALPAEARAFIADRMRASYQRGSLSVNSMPPNIRAQVLAAIGPMDTRTVELLGTPNYLGTNLPASPSPAFRASVDAVSVRLGVAIVGGAPGVWAPGAGALREVAKTLIEALRELGHDCIPCHYQRAEGRRLIVLDAQTIALDGQPLPPPDSILYNFEHPTDAFGFSQGALELYRRFVTWHFDPFGTAALRAAGVQHARCVPLGSVPSLAIPPNETEQDIDVLFIGQPTLRRVSVVDDLRRSGLRVVVPSGLSFGARRQALIRRARIHVNLHDETVNSGGHFEAVRVSLLLANRGFVLSEPSTTTPWSGGYAIAERADMVAACRYYVDHPELRAQIAARGHDLFMADRMSAHLRTALEELGILSPATNRCARRTVAPCDDALDYVLSESGVGIPNQSYHGQLYGM